MWKAGVDVSAAQGGGDDDDEWETDPDFVVFPFIKFVLQKCPPHFIRENQEPLAQLKAI